jgi:hypothetical protein
VRFLIVIRKTSNGCLMQQALTNHLDLMAESGEKLPKPKKRVALDMSDLEEEDYCTWVEVKAPAPVSSVS